MVGLDPSWLYVYVNEAAERLQGRPASELLGKRIWDIFPEAVGTRFHEASHRALETGEPEVFEEHYEPFAAWFEIRAYPSDSGLWVWFHDITAQKKAASAGRDERGRYREFFERSPAALYRTAPDGRLLDINDALIALLGYADRESFMAVNAADVYVDREDRERWQDLLDRQDRVVFEMRDRRCDGSIIWVSDTARVVRDEAGKVTCYEGMLEDITAEKEAEHARLETEERFRLLARASDDVIWDWGIDTGAVCWNDALKDVFGYDPASIGSSIERSYTWWLKRVAPQDRERVASTLHAAVKGGASSWTAEYRFRRLDGGFANVHDRGFIGRDAEGQPMRMVGAMLDLDRRVVAEPATTADAADGPPVPRTSDATLMRWIEDGDEHAFEDLYGRHAATVFAVAREAATTAEDAEEVVADVFLRAWSQAHRYDPDRGSVTGWLGAMARSRSLDRTKKQTRRSRLLECQIDSGAAAGSIASGFESSGVSAGKISERILLEKSLAELPEPQRRVLELAYIGGLSHSEIATKLEEPLGTVKTRIRAGLARMRNRVTAED